MSGWVAGALVVGAVATTVASNRSATAAQRGADSQSASAAAGIEEQRRQYDETQKLLEPYVTGGVQGLGGQKDLLGLNGVNAQQGAVSGIQNSPMFGALAQQGEDALLQNASATGGLRGGNTQGALAQFRPQLLNSLINQQYERLGGLSQMGQSSATGQAAAGQGSANNIADLLAQQGAAQAGAALAQGRAYGQAASGITGMIGSYVGGKF